MSASGGSWTECDLVVLPFPDSGLGGCGAARAAREAAGLSVKQWDCWDDVQCCGNFGWA